MMVVEKPDGSTLTTSILNLYPLELEAGESEEASVRDFAPVDPSPSVGSSGDDHQGAGASSLTLNPKVGSGPAVRPKRKAASAFQQRLTTWINDDAI